MNTPQPDTSPKTEKDFRTLLKQHLTTSQYRRVIRATRFALRDARFYIVPAATSSPERPAKHHGEIGGLARHTWEVLAFALGAASAFPGRVDLVVLAIGTILHDCGKMDEYAPTYHEGVEYWKRATPLVSHIMHGLQSWALWSEGVNKQDFHQVTHLIASHHGRREWGSPVVPSTLEAFILHSADVQSLMLNGVDNPAYRP
jgi:3'-5' exoribonuclease